jgi:hypothetical protein
MNYRRECEKECEKGECEKGEYEKGVPYGESVRLHSTVQLFQTQ